MLLLPLLDAGVLRCPTCRGITDGAFHDAPLALEAVHAEVGGEPWHGFLRCAGCGTRYPLVDGVAVVLADVASFLRQQERPLFARDDLPGPVSSWLLAAWDDEQDPNWRRQMVAIYGRTLEPPEPSGDPLSAALDDAIRATAAFFGERRRALIDASGPAPLVIDAGAGVGASSLDLARRGARVIAVDTDLGALKILARLAAGLPVEVPRWRHGGFDYVPHELPAEDPVAVLPVAGDAASPPIGAGVADLATAYHLLDNVPDPVLVIRQLHAALRPGGALVTSSPYDWVSRCTPREARIGEAVRSRAEDPPDAAAALRDLLRGRLPVAPELSFEITHEVEALPWVLKRHQRSYHVFLAHYVEATRR